MATPRRVSARIKARTPSKVPKPPTPLDGLLERDESPEDQQSLNATIEHGRVAYVPGAFESPSFVTTPSARPEPDRENMHPSKIHQSTTKTADTGLLLGFSDIKKRGLPAAVEDTPSKSRLIDPGFKFNFANKEDHLSAETRHIMESVREEAAKIKEQMRKACAEQALKDNEAEASISGRKIAQPRSRFSEVHKAQFSKMDSIANHPSIAKFKKTVPKFDQAAPQSLKRTQSKADLHDERPANPAPSKRAKATDAVDVSAARPVSRDGGSRPVSRDGSSIPRPAELPAFVTTPTKASLARSTSVKSARNTKIPGLAHSKSSFQLSSPKKVAEDSTARSLFGLKKSISMKSILSKPQPKYSDDPIKIAAGTHLPVQVETVGTPVKAAKRVEFAVELTSPTPVRPSGIRMPTKILTPFRRLDGAVNGSDSSPTRPVQLSPAVARQSSPELMQLDSTPASPSKTSPNKAAMSETSSTISPNLVAITSPSPRKIIAPVSCAKGVASGTVPYPCLSQSASKPSGPGDFTFRADRQIKFGPAQTIRAVRPSGVPTALAPLGGLPSVPHGMPGKKRARPDDDEAEERENVPPTSGDESSPSKKLRFSIGQDVKKPSTPRKTISNIRSTTTPGSGKKGLSLSRLNFLSRPKHKG